MTWNDWKDIIITLTSLVESILVVLLLPYTIIGIQEVNKEKKEKSNERNNM